MNDRYEYSITNLYYTYVGYIKYVHIHVLQSFLLLLVNMDTAPPTLICVPMNVRDNIPYSNVSNFY